MRVVQTLQRFCKVSHLSHSRARCMVGAGITDLWRLEIRDGRYKIRCGVSNGMAQLKWTDKTYVLSKRRENNVYCHYST